MERLQEHNTSPGRQGSSLGEVGQKSFIFEAGRKPKNECRDGRTLPKKFESKLHFSSALPVSTFKASWGEELQRMFPTVFPKDFPWFTLDQPSPGARCLEFGTATERNKDSVAWLTKLKSKERGKQKKSGDHPCCCGDLLRGRRRMHG